MRINFDMPQLETMGEGVILLDKHAVVKASNSAARGWLEECVALTEHFRALIKSERAGQLLLPAAVQLQGTWGEHSPFKVSAWLCKDGRWDYVLFIARPTPEQEFKSNETRFVSMVGIEARKEMEQLRNLLADTQQDAEAVVRQCARVDRLLIEIDHLATLFQRDKLFLADRLSLNTLLLEVLPGLPRQGHPHAISYKIIEPAEPLGIVYGDAAWLKYAFDNLLAGLGESAPPQSEVVLKLRQLGDFIVIISNVQKMGKGFSPGARALKDDKIPALERDIRLQMCHRIVELHGGHLKVTYTDPDEPGAGIEFFTLNLLTGMPDADRTRASCAQCRYTLQSYAYAQDLSALMAERA